MAMPIRTSMRMLSRRWQHLQHCPVPASSLVGTSMKLRHASRYSSPNNRSSTISASTDHGPAFTDVVTEPANASLPVRDPLLLVDPVGERFRQQARRARRTRFAIFGFILSSVGIWATVQMIESEVEKRKSVSADASEKSNATFQGKEVHVIGVGEGKRIVAEDAAGVIDLVETGTSSVPHFPKVIYLPTAKDSDMTDPNAIAIPNSEANPGNRANLEEYTLLGLGIRSVSFLSIQVYVMGMYVRTTDLTGLQARLIHTINPSASTLIPSEKEDLQARLLSGQSSSEIWDGLLQTPGIKTAWRVVPTRNTDFMHLRDGWITGINKRTAEAKKNNGNVPSEYDREDFGLSVRSFMTLFQAGKAPKGSVMTLARAADGGLDVFYAAKPEGSGQEKEIELLGSVADQRISKLIWMNYLAGDKVSSEQARKGVAEGCVALAGRPVGSAEAMVA